MKRKQNEITTEKCGHCHDMKDMKTNYKCGKWQQQQQLCSMLHGRSSQAKKDSNCWLQHKSHSLNRRLHNLTDKQTNELAIAFELNGDGDGDGEQKNTRCPTLSRKQKLIAKY